MNIIQKLTISYLKENKRQTLVTLIGVILSVTMITAVATSAASFMDLLQRRTIQIDGNWHVLYEDVPKESLSVIENDSDTKATFYSQSLGHARLDENKYSSKPYFHLLAFNESAQEAFPVNLIQGRFPANSHEILLSKDAIYNSGVNYQIGDTITLTVGQRVNEFGEYLSPSDWGGDCNIETLVDTKEYTFTIVGITSEPRYISSWGPAFTVITALDSELDATLSSVDVSVQLSHITPKLYNHAMQVASEANVPKDATKSPMIAFNKELLRFYGVTGNDSMNLMIYSLAFFFMCVIMIGSVSVIYNAFSISASKRMKHLGMLASVGATKAQKCSAILFEGVVIGTIAIPLGLLFGTIGMGVTFNLVNPIFQSAANMTIALRLVISAPSIIIAILFSILTIFISAWIPARRAAKVSPMIAIRQNTEVKIPRRAVKTSKVVSKIFGIEGDLALKNIKRQKRRYRATVFSLILSFSLFLITTYFLNTLQSAYNLTLETINYDLYMSGDSNDYGYALSHSSESLLIDEIVSLPSVKDYNYIQKAYTYTSITEDLLTEQAIELLKGEQSDTDFSALLNQFELKIYGIRDDVFNRYIDQNNEISNSSTIPIVVINTNQFLKDNKYMQVNLLKEIDHLTFHSNEYQFNVLGYTSELPMGITYDFLSNNIPVITPLSAIEGMFEQGVFDGGYSNLSLYLTSDDTSTLENEIVNLYQEANSLTMPIIFSLQKSHESQKQLELLISIFAYGFICLITLICLVNVFNTITTSMLLRTREFAMIRSVGMDSKSFNKMIRFESLFYGLKALLYGIPLSIGLMYIVYQILKSNFEIPFTLPWSSFIIAIFGIFIFVGLSMWYSLIQIRKLNIIDALKQENI